MQKLKADFCRKHKISWPQQLLINDVKYLWIVALNKEDWTYVEKILQEYPAEIEPKLYALNTCITEILEANMNLNGILIKHFSSTNNINYLTRAFDTLFGIFIYKDHNSERGLKTFYDSFHQEIDALLAKMDNIAACCYNIYLRILLGNNLIYNLNHLFEICKHSYSISQRFDRFVTMCIIFKKCDVLQNIYNSLHLVGASPPVSSIYLVHRYARIIQKKWRAHNEKKYKRHLVKVCYALEMPFLAYVIYRHSSLLL